MSHRVDLLIFQDFQLLDAAGPIAALEIASRIKGDAYRLCPVAVAPGPVTSSSGAVMMATDLDGRDAPDTLIVAGGDGVRTAAACPRTLGYVREAAQTARRITSVCSGSYVLAAAGVLDGRRATTHWSRTAHFARSFPAVTLEPDRIFVRDGHIWTSAGISAGIDLALALIAEDLGDAVARATARQLVLPYRRTGGQSQFSSLLESQRPDGRFAALLDWAREHLAEPLTVERLAGRAAMSPRHFARAFKAETGVTPARAVERLRLEAARARVEADTEPIEAIALATGFGDPERMRRAFVRGFGQPPQALRRTARSSPATAG